MADTRNTFLFGAALLAASAATVADHLAHRPTAPSAQSSVTGLADVGPCSVGPCSAGPCSAGPCSAGPCSAGPCSAGPCSAG